MNHPELTLAGATKVELDKRTYLPGMKMKWTCSACGKKVTRDFGKDYLNYPSTNVPFTVHLWCGGYNGCDFDEDTVEVVLKLSLELA